MTWLDGLGCSSQLMSVLGGPRSSMRHESLFPELATQADELSKRSGQASVAYELVKVGQRCEVLKWIGERAGGGVAVDAPHNYAHRAWTAPDPPGLIAAALKALSTR